ncbi:heat shock 70 kDa protein 12B-like [Ylistrum balloti]|uniref:heat shock 70 kDa protein 12B-like n=1 Tax=Ylistrum balloti TaxID=509963 RepID=UPI002905C602|nr:heat shock 70 kDa protein 12B-like [Ylistrum balloti]
MATCAEEVSKTKLVVAAIDFGTTYSGYAFAFQKDYSSDHHSLRIYGIMSKNGCSQKAPTCVLFNPQGKFDSFGYDAENRYAELTLTNEHQDWYYFRRFKMMLYNNPNITWHSILKDDKGKSMNAIKVFSAIISYLRQETLRNINERVANVGIKENEINWVLTVPAIWSDQAKQFMREAAKKAGIHSDQLDIALEPEAASIYCKHISVSRRERQETHGAEGVGLEAMCPGTKYLVLDAGGGTIDITVQRVQENGTLHQVYMANGGDWGGTKVDEAYEAFLEELVGQNIWEAFKAKYMDSYIDIFREFETKKRTISPDIENRITFTVPPVLRDVYEEMKNSPLSTTQGHHRNRKLIWKGDRLRVDVTEAKKLFETTCALIVAHVERILDKEETAGTSDILMVGGFSESPMLSNAIKERFGHTKRVIIPEEAGLSVLKGAVLFGFDTRVVSLRVMKHTYGIQSSSLFRKNLDPDITKTMVKGKLYCEDRFSKHVKKGQSVRIDEETQTIDYHPLDDREEMAVKVYITDKYDPEYCDTELCSYIGQLLVCLPMDVPTSDRGVKVNMKFGGTELSVRATVMATNQTTHAEFRLLE